MLRSIAVRQMAVLYLLKKHIDSEQKRMRSSRELAQVPEKKRWLYMVQPTHSTIWKRDWQNAPINIFFRKYGNVDSELTQPNQINRVVQQLRELGLIEERGTMDASERTLILTPLGEAIASKLVKIGEDPRLWPNEVFVEDGKARFIMPVLEPA